LSTASLQRSCTCNWSWMAFMRPFCAALYTFFDPSFCTFNRIHVSPSDSSVDPFPHVLWFMPWCELTRVFLLLFKPVQLG
jgi:hypothetical protein